MDRPTQQMIIQMKSALIILVCLIATTAVNATPTAEANKGPAELNTNCANISFYGPSGVISSPGYPGNYNNSLSCDFYVEAAKFSSLSFFFTSFNTEGVADFVTISCPSNSSFLPITFSGNSLPDPVSVPWCTRGLVHFSSNEAVVASGFSLTYYVSDGGCGNTVYGYSYGFVTSPNYPSNYAYSQNCSNIIWAPDRNTFDLYFLQFQQEKYCSLDWLEISCLDNPAYGPYRYCGYNTNARLTIYDCSQVLLWFHSDDSNNYQGFNIEYNVRPESETTYYAETTSPPPVTNFDPVCGSAAYYGPSGVISSPNYPGNYSINLFCDYYIYAEAGSTLSIFFKTINTEVCCDFVTISCPGNSSYPPQQFSGNAWPEPLTIPSCSLGLVHFSSDDSIVGSGFSLDYYVNSAHCEQTVYGGDYGWQSYPIWTDYYRYNMNCSTIIWAPQRSYFNLQFSNLFDIEADCTRDWVELSCLDNALEGPYRYCGHENGILAYIYDCTQVLVWFHSDGLNNYQGYELSYQFYPYIASTVYTWATTPSPPTTTPELTAYTEGTSSHSPSTTVNPDCGGSYYYGSYGVIRSPNYPDYYGNSLYCDYYVEAPTGSSLLFVFISFHVENADFLTISCTSNSNFPPHEYSGHSLPEPVSISVCSEGRVNFRTDSAGVSSGFSLEYRVSDAGCGNTLYTGSNGYLNSPNWPEYYGFNQNCSNIIWAPEQSTINLYFHSFNLQDNCSCDWLEISCLDNSEFGPTRYCGNYNSYNLYIYRCSQVLLWFHSDAFTNYQGFLIEHTIYPVGACGDISYTGPSGVISSPNYPGNYTNFLYCDYTIHASTGNSLSLIFDSLNIQEGFDLVTISCPENENLPKYELTGDNLPTPILIPDCSQGLVNFHTDATGVSSGFSLKYFVNEGGCGNTTYFPSTGQVTSPNWPNKYGHSQNCYNIIDGYERSTFYLNFRSFILQSCCSCDWLEISCLDNPEFGPTRYCEYYASFDTYINDCSQVLLWFHSDGSGNDQGFNIEYSIYPTADDSNERSNRTLDVRKHVSTNGGKPSAAQSVPRSERPNTADKMPSKRKPNAADNVPINSEPNAAESAPNNEKPIAEEAKKGK